MNVLILDLSTSTGYSVQNHTPNPNGPAEVALVAHGTLVNDLTIEGFGEYPFNYLKAARNVADLIRENLLNKYHPDLIVIEETNGGGRHSNRYTQKILEFIHYAVLEELEKTGIRIVYVNTSDWRKATHAQLTAEDKKINAKVAKAKRESRRADGTLDLKKFNSLKKQIGVRGKVNKKHVAIRLVNSVFGLNLRAKDDDIADAVAMGLAVAVGIKYCDGK